MSVTKKQGGTRKGRSHRPILFGTKFLRLHVGSRNRCFTAHEDLLCSRSPYLKERLQKNRKEVKEACTICSNSLDSHADEVTFCKTCGQNFHDSCMTKQLEKVRVCPACAAKWETRDDTAESTFPELDSEGFEVYIQWLYGQQIPSYTADCRLDDRHFRLIKAHLVGETLQDADFQLAVRNEFVKGSLSGEGGIRSGAIAFAYERTNGPCTLRRFLVDLYALTSDAEWLGSERVPRPFLVDMAQSFMDKSKELRAGEDVWSIMTAVGHLQ